ncbi:MAG: TauD/TfdA family dioxygenase [Pseudomonadota bacterium]
MLEVIDGCIGHRSTVWLRNHCQCAACRDPSHGQRVARFNPSTLGVSSIEENHTDGVVIVTWDDGHMSTFARELLLNRRSADVSVEQYAQHFALRDATCIPRVSGASIIADDVALLDWLEHLVYGGVAIVQAQVGQEAFVEPLAKRISGPMSSMYGNVWDVVTKPNPINIAYSSSELALHMDLVYLESPPGLQFLHCIENGEGIVGGESQLLDMFLAASDFRVANPDYFETLALLPMSFQKVHYQRRTPVHIVARRPIFEIDSQTSELVACHWAPAFEGTLALDNAAEEKRFYEAYFAFADFISTHPATMEFRLEAGDVLTFNNRTIAHGRRAFTMAEGATRRLAGTYVNIDEFLSRVCTLRTALGRHVDRPLAPIGNRLRPLLNDS